MPDQSPISVFVKLEYWEVYRSSVVLMASVFRKILYISGAVVLLWFAVSALLLFRPAPEQDWSVMMRDANPMKWVLGIPAVIVFVLPLLSARRLLKDERFKQGVSYQFSDAGIHVETLVSKADLAWAAVRRISETRSAFLIFTNPNVSNIVPKRSVENTQCVAALRELFRTHVSSTKLRPE